jgi:hypothetical protein
MTRNVKVLGLAVVAVLALSAVVASAAQAHMFRAASYPAFIHGDQDGGTHIFEIAGGRKFTCEEVTFTGTVASTAAAAEGVTVTPDYKKCHAKFPLFEQKLPVTVTMNGCDFLFTTPETKTPPDEYTGKVHLKCPENKKIEIHVYENATKHAEDKSLCTFSVGAKDNLGSITYHNKTNTPTSVNDVTLTGLVTNIPYTRTSGTLANCGGATGESTYTGNSTVTATDEFGNPNEIEIDDTE